MNVDGTTASPGPRNQRPETTLYPAQEEAPVKGKTGGGPDTPAPGPAGAAVAGYFRVPDCAVIAVVTAEGSIVAGVTADGPCCPGPGGGPKVWMTTSAVSWFLAVCAQFSDEPMPMAKVAAAAPNAIAASIPAVRAG